MGWGIVAGDPKLVASLVVLHGGRVEPSSRAAVRYASNIHVVVAVELHVKRRVGVVARAVVTGDPERCAVGGIVFDRRVVATGVGAAIRAPGDTRIAGAVQRNGVGIVNAIAGAVVAGDPKSDSIRA